MCTIIARTVQSLQPGEKTKLLITLQSCDIHGYPICFAFFISFIGCCLDIKSILKKCFGNALLSLALPADKQKKISFINSSIYYGWRGASIELPCPPPVCVEVLRVLWFPLTVQRHAGYFHCRLCIPCRCECECECVSTCVFAM